MMTTAGAQLRRRLPPVRGRYAEDSSLARFTWFRVGGPADVVFRPADEDDLVEFLKRRPQDVPVTVIGLGANLLVRDGGIEGVVVRLGRPFAAIEIKGEDVIAGGGAVGAKLARVCAEAGVGGLEFLSGIPGTLGGAVFMNAGAYGREIADLAVSVRIVGGSGKVRTVDAADMGFSYRHTGLEAGSIILSAHLRGERDARAVIRARLDEIATTREASQPVRMRTGGSTFVNPPGPEKAWQLIEHAGCRGLQHGSAMVSEKHCNFLINTGDATAADLENLGEEVIRRVSAATGVQLEWEVRRIGRLVNGGHETRKGSVA